jgi:hypothetical protein
MMPNYSGSISQEKEFLSYIPQRVLDLLDKNHETVVLIAFQRNSAGLYQYRIYSTKQKEDLFSGPLHEIASSLVSRNYELHVCCGFVSKRKIYTYEEFLKTR